MSLIIIKNQQQFDIKNVNVIWKFLIKIYQEIKSILFYNVLNVSMEWAP